MKASRLLSILMLLQTRGRMTAPALAREMEVSQRTILRDIDQLSAAGVPIWGERGRQGGFQLREGWSTSLTGMTESEAGALLLAGLPGPATDLGLGPAAASARLKMVASLPSAWRAQADRVGQCLHIDPVDWYRADDAPRFLREVADAVWAARRIDVHYDRWSGPVRRTLEPLGLVLKAGAWYLVARADGHSAPRTYRLASMLDVTPGSRPFKRPRDFDLAHHWQASIERFEAELHRLQARVQVSPRAMKWLGNGRTRVTLVAPERNEPTAPPGWRTVSWPIESIEHGARQLMGHGQEVRVLAPARLRLRMGRLARVLAATYA